MYPIYVTFYYSWVPNFTTFHSTTSFFRLTGHFQTSAANYPKWLWTQKGQRHPIYMLQLFTPFHSMPSHFRVIDHFETSALNDPKMALNTTRSKVHYMHITTTHKFHSNSLYVQCFWVSGHFGTSPQNDPKISLNTKRPDAPHICIPVSQISLFHSTISHS